VMTKVGAYATIRVFTLIFPPSVAATGTLFADLLFPAAVATLVIGAIGVLGSAALPRQAAFAGIASMGMIFLAVSAFTPTATAAALYYLIHSTFAGAALFLVADLVTRHRTGGATASLFLLSAIAMAGLPPVSGFIGKLLVMDALRAQAPLIWTVILTTSFLMILGFARTGSRTFWKADPTPISAEPMAIAATFALIAALAALTIFAGPVMAWLQITADALHTPAAYITANQLGVQP
jgi:multicomponent K+:H+ antiporter subunit D